MKKAAVISAISKYSTIFLNLLFSAILARLLSPEDYGIVAVTVVFSTFFSLFSDMGIGAGIIQSKELSQNDVDNIFTFSIRLGVILCFAFIIFSYPMALFYKNKVFIPIGIFLATSLLFSTLNIVPNAILLKQKKFLRIGQRTVILCIISGIIGIVFAYLGLKYYALVLQTAINSFFTFLWNYVSTRPKLVWKIKKESILKIKNYSSFLFAFNIINYFSRNTDNLLISKFMGTASLGYYDKAYKLMCYPTQNLTHVITPILHPILSEYQNDKAYIYERYLRVVKLLSLCGIFIMPFCFFASSDIIRIMFGEHWISSIPCFKWMSISIWAQMVTSSSGSIFQSLGDSKKMFFSGMLNTMITVLAIVLGIIAGDINAIARNIGIIYNFHFVSTYIILVHYCFKFSYRNFLKFMLPDFMIMAGMFILGKGIEKLLIYMNIENIYYNFGIKLFCFLLIYATMLVLSKQYKFIINLIKK